MTRYLVVVGGPGKTTLCRFLARQNRLHPLLLVDHAPADDLNALFKLIDADEMPSLHQMQQTPQYDLQQTECLLAEGLTSWGNYDADLLKASQPLQPLTPLWKSACKRLFARHGTVLMDDWQPAWQPWLAECTVLALGPTPPTHLQHLEGAAQLGWLQVETADVCSIKPYSEDRVFWPKVGRIPWVAEPVRKQHAYQQAVLAMLERLG